MEPILNMLLVEDNPGDVIIFKELLKSSGINFKFTHSTNLKDAIILSINHHYDIILLDLGLNDSIGLDTLKKVVVNKVDAPVVVMTGLDDENIALASLREGAQDYLVKNRLTADVIVRTIKYSIERKKIQNLQQIYAHRFSILSLATAALHECDDVSSIYRIISAHLKLLLEKKDIIAVEIDDPANMHGSGTEWLKRWVDQITHLTGWDMNKPVFNNINHKTEIVNCLYDNKLHKFNDGIKDIFKDIIGQKEHTVLKSVLNLKNVYAIGLLQHKIFYGGFLIFSNELIEDDDIRIIDAICSQTSLSIHRKWIEKNLRTSEYRYRKLNKELEEKVRERTHDLEFLNDKLQQELTDRRLTEEALKKNESQLKELNATKDKFFNIVAHDLKNPFTSLLGSSELLFQNINQLDHENIRKLALILNDSAKSGYAILQNLLDWSRSQTGLLKFNPEGINLKNLIEENIINLELFSANKQIEINSEIDEDLFIFADKNMINTVLRNLLTNALKFSYRFGKIVIGADVNDNAVIVSVKDFGIGIPRDIIENIFLIDTKYSKPGTENEQGTGLGLKLCKEFVEKQGGNIWVESIENKGSEFKFSISAYVV
jgi:signal transduction histidine kinase/DNA-binding NarL/FixJ family response regulator